MSLHQLKWLSDGVHWVQGMCGWVGWVIMGLLRVWLEYPCRVLLKLETGSKHHCETCLIPVFSQRLYHYNKYIKPVPLCFFWFYYTEAQIPAYEQQGGNLRPPSYLLLLLKPHWLTTHDTFMGSIAPRKKCKWTKSLCVLSPIILNRYHLKIL